MINSYVTVSEFEQFLVDYQKTVNSDKKTLLMEAFLLMNSLPWKIPHNEDYIIEDVFLIAQQYIACCIDSGVIDLMKGADAKQLIHRNIGRTAIEKNWIFDKELAKSDPVSLLKHCPLAYSMLMPFLNYNGLLQPPLVRV